jgi:1-acyl-sn-glycerol-3-phosphate acyltransferase
MTRSVDSEARGVELGEPSDLAPPSEPSELARRKRPAFAGLFRAYLRWRMRRAFSAVRIRGLPALRALAAREPLLLAANHVAWWDPLVLIVLDGVLTGDARCLMDASNLRRLPFFSLVGALPLDRSAPRAAVADLAAAARLLDRPGRVLIIFPQGEQRPAHLPLELRPGIEWLARKSGARVVPLALRYDFREEPRPELNVSIGEPLGGEAPCTLPALGEALGRELARIDAHLLAEDASFVPLLSSASGRISLGARLLAWLTRGAR